MAYRNHEKSPVVAARDAIREAVEESRLARLEAQGKRERRRVRNLLLIVGGLVVAGGGLALSGFSVLALGAVAAIAAVVILTFWLGSTVDPHGDEPPLRRH